MRILIVDDEIAALNQMRQEVSKAEPNAQVEAFMNPLVSVECAEKNRIDVAFLDIKMREMSGLELAKRLKEIYKKTNIIFATAYSEYALGAISMYASGYLIKPVMADSISESLANLRHPIPITAKGLRVQAFGNFEVFVDEVPMEFRYSKSKELLAYLIDRRGALVTIGELCAVLWEDKPESMALKSQLRNIISELSRKLAQVGKSEALIRRRGSYGISPDSIDCDYFRFLRRETEAVNRYAGEYMSQYSWAEMTIGFLKKTEDFVES